MGGTELSSGRRQLQCAVTCSAVYHFGACAAASIAAWKLLAVTIVSGGALDVCPSGRG